MGTLKEQNIKQMNDSDFISFITQLSIFLPCETKRNKRDLNGKNQTHRDQRTI